MFMVVVRGLKMNLPPCLGDIEPIRKSKDVDLVAGKQSGADGFRVSADQ